jgi:hypothetical protein
MMRVMMNDRIYSGSPEAVVDEMWNECFHRDTLPHIEEYIAYVAGNVFKFAGFGININARTIEEKSRRLLEGLMEVGIARDMEQ